MTRRGAAAVAGALLALAACGKPPEPKVDAATERAQAHERARKDAFGTQVQALDKAKALQDDINKKAAANIDQAEAAAR